MSIKVNIEDVVIAYRKAKADLYYSSMPCALRIVEFEKNLDVNLNEIKRIIAMCDINAAMRYCSGYLLTPKKLKLVDKKKPTKGEGVVVFSNRGKKLQIENVEEAVLRVMIDTPVQFHVIMNWWILKIGEKFEKKLSENSYGNRIRRHKDGTVSKYAIGTFSRYFAQYRAWRDNGLRAIRDVIDKGDDAVAITADFVSFYHKIDPSFLLNAEFYKQFDCNIVEEELQYTKLIVRMLQKWTECTPLDIGLPVGCSISAVIANLALSQFDRLVERELSPVYYGRYVDDVIIVMRNTNGFDDASRVWEWIKRRISALEIGKDDISYIDKLINSDGENALIFEKSKTKVFIFDRDSGYLLLDSLEEQIKSRSSEWRSLPNIPDKDREMATKILAACDDKGEEGDSLRKVDSVSLKRAIFAMTVRDFEAYGRALNSQSWQSTREKFLWLIEQHFTDLGSFFDLNCYLSRIISCACACLRKDNDNEIDAIARIIAKLFDTCKIIRTSSKMRIAGAKDNKEASNKGEDRSQDFLGDYLVRLIAESVVGVVVDKAVRSSIYKRLQKIDDRFAQMNFALTLADMRSADVARFPTRFDYSSVATSPRLVVFKDDRWWRAMLKFYSKMIKGKQCTEVPLSMLFPTRPFNAYELSKLQYNSYLDKENRSILDDFLRYSRGYGSTEDACIFPSGDEDNGCVGVDWHQIGSTVNIALANWMTSSRSYEASVRKTRDVDEAKRYNRLMRLINEILASGVKVDYVVFPELSIPPKWFDQIAIKLKASGISLVAGVEYIHDEVHKTVRNQVWCSLMFDGCGFPDAMVFKFEKARPAIHEAEYLYKTAGLRMTSEVLEGVDTLDERPIVCHGDLADSHFDFSAVICSDLTNIHYRAQLQGKVDAIFVPAWNQDEELFASLVESAAYDVHSYVIECNDREYSDTRIRAPYKKDYKRDVVRIKGGERDYFVIGKLDIEKLRRFQDNVVSPTGSGAEFKPVPIGFEMVERRKIKHT